MRNDFYRFSFSTPNVFNFYSKIIAFSNRIVISNDCFLTIGQYHFDVCIKFRVMKPTSHFILQDRN